MGLIQIIKKIYLGYLPNEAYINNKNSIDNENYRSLKYFTRYSAPFYALLTIASVCVSSIRDVFYIYFSMTVFMAFAHIITMQVISKHKNYSCVLLYTAEIVIMATSVILGTFYNSSGNAAAFICVVAIFPSQILDKPGRVMITATIMTIIFCISAYIVKIPELYLLDITNACAFLIVSFMLIIYTVRTKMAGIVSKARLEWNDLRYRSLLQDFNNLVFDYNPENGSFHISDKGKEYTEINLPFGYFGDYAGIYPDDKPCMDNIFESSADHLNNELRFYNKSKDIVWVKIQTIRLMDSSGKKTHIVGRITNINERKLKEELLLQKAQTDPLTGLYNKTATESLISDALSKEEDNHCALILADVDDLKNINDTFGHAEGDRAIIGFAKTLKTHFRTTDIVGRVGGDEFMAFLGGEQNVDALKEIAAELVKKIEKLHVGENGECSLSGSIGIALRTDKNERFEHLYKMADIALYDVKKNGKNNYSFKSQNNA